MTNAEIFSSRTRCVFTGAIPNDDRIVVGHCFSIEPGIYLDGKWGMRLGDIVVIGQDGKAIGCNQTNQNLVSVG